MKDYEKDLRKLLDLTDQGQKPILEEHTGLTRIQLTRLSEKYLISLRPAGDNRLRVFIEDAGKVYFENRAERIQDRIIQYTLSNWIALAALIVAVISLLRTF